MFVTVENQGPGRTYNSQVNIKNESGEGVLIHDGRFELDVLQPGDTRTHAFELEVIGSFQPLEIELELAITEFELREEVAERLVFPIVEPTETTEALSGVASFAERTPVYERPDAGAHRVGWLVAGSNAAVTRQMGEFVRATIGEGRTGWVQRNLAELSATEDSPPQARFEVRMDNTPPEITFSSEPPLRVSSETLTLRGEVHDDDRVLDMYIFVGRRKMFYLSNRGGEDQTRTSFNAELPLEPGSNYLLIVARESGDVVARRILIVRRDGASQNEARGEQ